MGNDIPPSLGRGQFNPWISLELETEFREELIKRFLGWNALICYAGSGLAIFQNDPKLSESFAYLVSPLPVLGLSTIQAFLCKTSNQGINSARSYLNACTYFQRESEGGLYTNCSWESQSQHLATQ